MLNAWRGEPVCEDTTGTYSGLPGAAAIAAAFIPLSGSQPFGPLALAQVGKLGLPYLASPLETLDVLSKNYQRHGEAVATAGAGPVVYGTGFMRAVFHYQPGFPWRTMCAACLEKKLSPQAALRGEAAVDAWAIVGDKTLCPGFAR